MTLNNHSKEIDDQRRTAPQVDVHDTATQTIASILQLAIVGLLIGALLHDVNLPTPVLGLCVILLLWLIVRTSATMLLIALQMVLFFREPNRSTTHDAFGSVLYVAVALGLLTFLSRDQSLKRLISRTVPDLIKSFFGKPNAVLKPSPPASDRPPVLLGNRQSTSLIRQIVMLLVCVLVSQLLLTTLAISEGVENGSRSVPNAGKLLKQVSPLLIITFVAVIVTSELAWRRLTIGQASMYLRSTQVMQLHVDLRMIIKSRLKFFRRQKKTPPNYSPSGRD